MMRSLPLFRFIDQTRKRERERNERKRAKGIRQPTAGGSKRRSTSSSSLLLRPPPPKKNHNSPHVAFCGYSSEAVVNLRIQTTGEVSAAQALRQAAADLRAASAALRETCSVAWEWGVGGGDFRPDACCSQGLRQELWGGEGGG